MSLLGAIRRLWRFIVPRTQSDVEEEFRSTLNAYQEDLIRQGLPEEEARRKSRIDLGQPAAQNERYRDAIGLRLFDELSGDIRYGLRGLRRNPGFAAIAVLTLALGIGANAAMFSVVQGVLLAPLPFPEADRLVFVWQDRPGVPQLAASYPNFEDWTRSSQSFESMAALGFHNFDLTAPGKAEHLNGIRVSYAFLATLGVAPVIGRDFRPSDDLVNSAPTAIISNSLWKERFGADPGVIGKSVVLDARTFTILGVLPAQFYFVANADVITPLRPLMPAIYTDRSVDSVAVIGRLNDRTSLRRADDEMNAIQRDLDQQFPSANHGVGIALTSLKTQIVGDVKGTLLLLLGAVGLVLLIACANVANLLMARSTARAREFAIRAALGATRGRMVRQLLTECILMSIAGGTLGSAIAAIGIRALLSSLPQSLPRSENIGLHLPVLVFTMAVSIVACILFGLAPALSSADADLGHALQKTTRNATSGRNASLGRLVTVQFALTLVLLSGAGMLMHSIRNLWQVNPGFDANHLLTFHVGLSPSAMQSAAATRSSYQQLLSRIRGIPGIESADLTNIVPLSGSDNGGPFWIGNSQPASLQTAPHALYFWTGPNYAKTMRVPLLQGRFFTPADELNSGKVVVIDRVLAQKFFPGQNPVGQTLTVAHWGAARIIGIVGHVRHWGLDDPGTYNPNQIYIPVSQLPDYMVTDFFRNLSLIVRTTRPSADVVKAIESVVYAASPDQPVYGIQTVDELISQTMASRKLAILLLGIFSGLALLLSSIGIYGVISYSVALRTREIGIRMALGANRHSVFRMVVYQAIGMAGTGVLIGVGCTIALVGLLPSFSHLLYGVGLWDPLTSSGVLVLLLIAALSACYVPARRAMLFDPMESLRGE